MKNYIPSQLYYNRIGITDDVLQKYYDNLVLHIGYVQEAGKNLGVSNSQLNRHDHSKWRKVQFGGYAKHFHGGGDGDLFAKAWLDHIHREKHHWEYWLFPNGYTPKGSNVERGVIQMPSRYALEMIADWQGASKAYTGDWDMAEWLDNNSHRIILHSKTAKFVNKQLAKLGYRKYDFRTGT